MKKKSSLYRRFVPAVMIPFVVLILIINLASFYLLYQSEQRVAKTAADLNYLYIQETDKSLQSVMEYLYLMGRLDKSIDDIRSADPWTRVSAERAIASHLKSGVNSFSLIDLLFVYEPETDDLLYAYGDSGTVRARAMMNDYLRQAVQDDSLKLNTWQVVRIQEVPFLLWTLKESGTYLGAWIRMEDIEKPLSALSQDTSSVSIVTDGDLTPVSHQDYIEENGIKLLRESDFYKTGRLNGFLVQIETSQIAPYYLCLVVPYHLFSGIGGALMATLLILSVSAFILIPVLMRRIRTDVLRPLKTLDDAINKIHEGDLTYQIGEADEPQEFSNVYGAFNEMTSNLKEAKIQAYEDVIEKQKLRLSYLQMQIRPHFFMNALTTVSNLSRLNKQEDMDAFIGYLAEYLRYMFRSNLILVPLKEEVRHVETYLNMQKLQFSGTLSHVFSISDESQDILIPPFTIHNFAENVIKHAMTDRQHVTLYLRVNMENDKLKILIEDNGKGLSEDALTLLNDPDHVPKKGKNIGIWNIRQTLNLLYGNDAAVNIMNSPLGGAKVEIIVPAVSSLDISEDNNEDPSF